MSKKPKQDDPKQSKRFIEAAKQAGADETEEAAARAFKKIVSAKQKPSRRERA